MSGNKEYDLICSLGGNCAASHNLLFRNLRPYALPFDWTYFKEDDTNNAIDALIDGFKTSFSKYMLQENLLELPVNEDHSDRIQYYDNYGKIIWANHFSCKIDENDEYNIVKNKFIRRFNRLNNLIETSTKILFLFSTSFNINEQKFVSLSLELKKLYPNKQIEIKVIAFNCEKDENIKIENLEIMKYKRQTNNYDFTQTNQEWFFLDNVLLSNKHQQTNDYKTKKLLNIIKIKKGVLINLFPEISTIFYINFYLFGIRFRLCVGKEGC